MKLTELLNGIKGYKLIGDPEKDIQAIAYDSRKVQPGTLFVALKGVAMDGHAYIRDAVQRGASAVVLEDVLNEKIDVPAIRVSDSRRALSLIALQFFRHPFDGVDLIGITGTNGKTTTSFILESILLKAGKRPGVIGTINYRYSELSRPAS
ncbi:MAG: Mur ligase domain-containing protein, partial [Desulfobacterales bacterium]|nr:Mur ligase domain-containing protein [Desulfobacterales bacterium]